MSNKKYVVSTVGVSIFFNFWKDTNVGHHGENKEEEVEALRANVRSWVLGIEKEPEANCETCLNESHLNSIKNYWLKGITKIDGRWQSKETFQNFYASSEIQSICKIIQESKEDEFVLKLLCSDTALSVFAGHLIKDFLAQAVIYNQSGQQVTIHVSKYTVQIVNGLTVYDAASFEQVAVYSLLSRVNSFVKNAKQSNVVINASGGYKALVYILTLYANIKKIDLVYLYEDSDELITLTPFPFDIDRSVYEIGGFLLNKNVLSKLTTALNNKEVSEQYQRYITWLQDKKLVKIDASSANKPIKTTALGGIVKALFDDRLSNDFGKHVLEPTLIELINSEDRPAVLKDYHMAQEGQDLTGTQVVNDKRKKIELGDIDFEAKKGEEAYHVIGELKSWAKNKNYDFYKMKGRVVKHPNVDSNDSRSVEFLYIVYTFGIDAELTSKVLATDEKIVEFITRFEQDEELKAYPAKLRVLGVNIAIDNPLEFDYKALKHQLPQLLQEDTNWVECDYTLVIDKIKKIT